MLRSARFLALPLLLLSMPALAGMEGHYRAKAGPDVAAELLLRPDGSFAYALSAGALDEVSQGRWQDRDGTVVLTAAGQSNLLRAGDAALVGGQVRHRLATHDGAALTRADLRAVAVTYPLANPLVVRDFVGHGVGQLFHDEPNIMHFGVPGTGIELKPGMIFTVEPMINLGRPHVKILSDGWTAVTRDRTLSAQAEHSIGITETGHEIFTLSPRGLFNPLHPGEQAE